jgi:hypothetical protein
VPRDGREKQGRVELDGTDAEHGVRVAAKASGMK